MWKVYASNNIQKNKDASEITPKPVFYGRPICLILVSLTWREWMDGQQLHLQSSGGRGKVLNSSGPILVEWSGDLHKSLMRAVNYLGYFPALIHLFHGCSSSCSALWFCSKLYPGFACILSGLWVGMCVLPSSFWTVPCRSATIQTGTECWCFSSVWKWHLPGFSISRLLLHSPVPLATWFCQILVTDLKFSK